MAWTRQQIRSDADPDSNQPWYEFDVDESNNHIEVTTDKDGGLSADMTGATLDFDSINPAEPFRVVITTDGTLTTYNMGDENAAGLRAHLSPATTVRDLTLYEFVEG